MKNSIFLRAIVLTFFTTVLLISESCSKKEEVNQTPTISSVQVNPSSAVPGTSVTVIVAATDADQDELSYAYEVSGGTISGSGSTAIWTAPSAEGAYTVNVTVSDGKGETKGSGQLTVSVPVNNPPVIGNIQVNPASADPGSTVSVTVTASDNDGDQLSYQYQVTGGAITGSGATATWTTPSQPGAYSVQVTVSDGQGGQVSGNGSVTVTQPITRITGTAAFPAGSSGDLANAKVSLYTSYDNWNNNIPIQYVAATGSGSNVSFDLTNVVPGIYYLDVWKDNDNSASWSLGDFVGWYGDGGLGAPSLTEISISEGQTKTVTISMMTIVGSTLSANTKVRK